MLCTGTARINNLVKRRRWYEPKKTSISLENRKIEHRLPTAKRTSENFNNQWKYWKHWEMLSHWKIVTWSDGLHENSSGTSTKFVTDIKSEKLPFSMNQLSEVPTKISHDLHGKIWLYGKWLQIVYRKGPLFFHQSDMIFEGGANVW